MAYWLMKSEPYKWSWDDQVRAGENNWQKEVRNYQARNNMQKMQKGDQVFFYHSNEGKEIIGIMAITREAYPDPRDETGKFVTVGVKPVKPLKNPVSLAQMKQVPALENIALIKQTRLSVMPVSEGEWQAVCALADEN